MQNDGNGQIGINFGSMNSLNFMPDFLFGMFRLLSEGWGVFDRPTRPGYGQMVLCPKPGHDGSALFRKRPGHPELLSGLVVCRVSQWETYITTAVRPTLQHIRWFPWSIAPGYFWFIQNFCPKKCTNSRHPRLPTSIQDSWDKPIGIPVPSEAAELSTGLHILVHIRSPSGPFPKMHNLLVVTADVDQP
jgi:hypothetical protein